MFSIIIKHAKKVVKFALSFKLTKNGHYCMWLFYAYLEIMPWPIKRHRIQKCIVQTNVMQSKGLLSRNLIDASIYLLFGLRFNDFLISKQYFHYRYVSVS